MKNMWEGRIRKNAKERLDNTASKTQKMKKKELGQSLLGTIDDKNLVRGTAKVWENVLDGIPGKEIGTVMGEKVGTLGPGKENGTVRGTKLDTLGLGCRRSEGTISNNILIRRSEEKPVLRRRGPMPMLT